MHLTAEVPRKSFAKMWLLSDSKVIHHTALLQVDVVEANPMVIEAMSLTVGGEIGPIFAAVCVCVMKMGVFEPVQTSVDFSLEMSKPCK